MLQLTKPDVFIIETLRLSDEKDQLQEGELIRDVLRRSQKNCEYIYVRTRQELVEFLNIFTKSRYRYLHISCHGGSNGIETTFDRISLSDFCEILRPHLANRRLFMSACDLTRARFAEKMFNGTKLLSLLGPADSIPFADAAAFWPSLYHALFKADHTKMHGLTLRDTAKCKRRPESAVGAGRKVRHLLGS